MEWALNSLGVLDKCCCGEVVSLGREACGVAEWLTQAALPLSGPH